MPKILMWELIELRNKQHAANFFCLSLMLWCETRDKRKNNHIIWYTHTEISEYWGGEIQSAVISG